MKGEEVEKEEKEVKKKRRGRGEGGDEEEEEITEAFKWTNNKSHKPPYFFF